jgi:folate-dependent phosphoribosylglycinamide formyltransferase PurN
MAEARVAAREAAPGVGAAVSPAALPSVVLICHAEDPIDTVGLASWLAASLRLVGIVVLRRGPGRLLRSVRKEIHRVGLVRFLDIAAFRVYRRLCLARSDARWVAREVARLRARYPVALGGVPRLVAANPNMTEVQAFLKRLQPDLVIARCKFILRPEVFNIPRAGTFVLHPGVCPEYRNAHGCFWALANGDLERVGMTLLRVDEGVDTGPILLQRTYPFNEIDESPLVIQYRVVLENLDAIRDTLITAWRGEARPIPTAGRRSATWGQPWLSAYWRWKRAARRGRR